MRKATVVGRMRWKTGERMAQLRRWLLNGFDVVVQRIHDYVAGGRAGAISSQLFQLQALSVFTAHVHQQTVVRYAEYSTRLRRRHLLVPHVLQRLGQFGVRPRSRWAAPGCAVLTLWSSNRQTASSLIRPPSRCVALGPVLFLLTGRMSRQGGRSEQSV